MTQHTRDGMGIAAYLALGGATVYLAFAVVVKVIVFISGVIG